MDGVRIQFATSARKHRIGRARALHVMANTNPQHIGIQGRTDPRLLWIGDDQTGRTLEIIALALPDKWLVIHVMPYDYRRR